MLGRRTDLPCDRIEHRDDEERIPARLRYECAGEGIVRLQAVQRASEHGDRGRPERFGRIAAASGVGDQLCDEDGIAALSPPAAA